MYYRVTAWIPNGPTGYVMPEWNYSNRTSATNKANYLRAAGFHVDVVLCKPC